MKKMWFVTEKEFIPCDDLISHQSGEGCWCFPYMRYGTLFHYSLDQREVFEQDTIP